MLSESYKNRLQFLSGILLEKKENHKNEYGCLMLDISHPDWGKMLNLIDKEDLYTEEPGFGLEKDPHVTILFGFHKNADLDKMKELINKEKLKSIKLKTKGLTIFETPDYDVVKLDVVSPTLHKLNKIMTSNFDYTNDYPDYHPHMTLAYVKKGRGKKYIDKSMESSEFESSKFTYSPEGTGKKTKFNL